MSKFFLVLGLIIVGVVSLLEFFNIIKKLSKNYLISFFANSLFTIYIFLFCFLFFFFVNFYQLKIILFAILLCCIASDIGGYIFGKTLKGPKLTKISPNKTISGAAGSLISSLIIFSVYIYLNTGVFNNKILFVSLITSVSCQVGDLLISYLKRKAKIKNTGNLLPGHGGILDRVDGILIGLPIGFFSFILLY
tara:strand:+ start:338 stop:916 length:579 start_codon:yes stop_codon:yes gene_type:complete